jgi:hypothetical protein
LHVRIDPSGKSIRRIGPDFFLTFIIVDDEIEGKTLKKKKYDKCAISDEERNYITHDLYLMQIYQIDKKI